MAICAQCGESLGEGQHVCASELRATKKTDVPTRRRTGRGAGPAQVLAAAAELELVPPAEDYDPMIGTLLGENYRIIERLGAGGMGTVYLVTHVHLKKKFAAKILNPDTAERPDALARFQQEAVAASRLDHDHIVNIVNFGQSDEGIVYLIMEFLRGEALNQILARGRLGVDDALRVAVPVCRGLGAAHAAGIVHRDLKPENIFVSRRSGGRHLVKLLDFGISKIQELHVAERRITQTGDVLGSPLYMSPEAARGDEHLDGRADIYAIGVMLFEMCTGTEPFMADNYLQVLYKHINEPPPRPRDLLPDLPEALEAIILRCLAKDPAERFQKCEDIEAALLAAVPDVDLDAPVSAAAPVVSTSIDDPLPTGATVMPTPVLTPRSIPAPVAARPPAPTPGPMAAPGPVPVTAETRPPLRTSRLAIVAGFMGTLGVLAFGAYALWQMRRPDAAAPAPVVVTATPAIPPIATSVAPPPAPVAAAAAPAPRTELTVASTPSGAAVIVDGHFVGETPLTLAVDSDARDHEVRVELAGYHPELRTVTFERGRAVAVALRRAAARKDAARPSLDIKEGR